MKKYLCLFFILLLSACLNDSELSKTSPVQLPFDKFVLENGLEVILNQDLNQPFVHLNLAYHVGSKNDPDHIQGFAHLFEHMMFQGSLNAPDDFLNNLKKLGVSDANAYTSKDVTVYHETVPSENLEKLLWLEADRMGFMAEALSETQFNNQKEVVKNEYLGRINQPYFESHDLMAEKLYPANHPYQKTPIGKMDHLAKATLSDVKDFYKQFYAPNNAFLTLSGNFDIPQTKEWIQKYFSRFKGAPQFIRPQTDFQKRTTSQKIVIEKDVPFEQIQLIWVVPPHFSKEIVPLDFAAQILGGDNHSRLYQKLVYEKEWAASANVALYTGELASQVMLTVRLKDPQFSDVVQQLIREEIEDLAQNGPTENELKRIRAQNRYSYISGFESISSRAAVLNLSNLYQSNPDYYQTEFAQYNSVQANEIKDTFFKWVSSAHELFIHYKPIQPQTEFLGSASLPEPLAATTPAFNLPKTQSAVLKNGLKVWVNTDERLPKVDILLLNRQNNIHEPLEKAGLSEFMSSLLERGTKNTSYTQLKENLSLLGAELSSASGDYQTYLSLSVLKENLDPAFEIFSEVALSPAFDPEEIKKVQSQFLDYLKSMVSSPSKISQRLAIPLAFGASHPLGSLASKDSILSLNQEIISQLYNDYWHPQNAEIIFSGAITLDEALSLCEASFKNWKPKNTTPEPFAPIPETSDITLYIVDFPEATQTSFKAIAKAPHRLDSDYPAFNMGVSVLGGTSGRLFKILREEKGFVYSAGAQYITEKDYGLVYFSFAAETAQSIKALDEFFKLLADFKSTHPVQLNEVKEAKAYLAASFKDSFGSIASVLSMIQRASSLGFEPETFFKEDKYYLTPNHEADLKWVRDAMAKSLDPSSLTLLMVGDASHFREALKNKSGFKIIELDVYGKEVVKP